MSAEGLFTRVFSAAPDGIWQAPGRVNLIGEHTDYNDGFVLPFAIDRAATAALSLRDDRLVRLASAFDEAVIEISLDELAPETVGGWSAYPLGIAWAFTRFGADLSEVRGFDLMLDSTVPVGAGLSSSAAIEMATAVALNDLWGFGFDAATLAKVGRLAENEVVGAPTGIMDQAASVFGKPDAAVFLDCRSLEVEHVPLGFRDAGLVTVVIDVRMEHAHATGGYRDRREACERGARILGVPALRDLGLADLDRAESGMDEVLFRRVRHVVTENERVLGSVDALRNGNLRLFGELMQGSHESMRYDFEISVPELDTVVETAMENGALGARLTGGGFGGTAIALMPEACRDTFVGAVHRRFAALGYREPVAFVVDASAGASRIA